MLNAIIFGSSALHVIWSYQYIGLALIELILETFTVLNSIENFKEGIIPIAVLKGESNVKISILVFRYY